MRDSSFNVSHIRVNGKKKYLKKKIFKKVRKIKKMKKKVFEKKKIVKKIFFLQISI